MNQKRGLILISLRHVLFITILRNIKEVNEIMRFLYPKYRSNRLTAQHAGGGYNDQSNYCLDIKIYVKWAIECRLKISQNTKS